MNNSSKNNTYGTYLIIAGVVILVLVELAGNGTSFLGILLILGGVGLKLSNKLFK
jgi:multisubunit Na+/H+ antiporter MnhG subunit